MELQERLKMLGLNAYETRSYIAMLSLGTAEANTISSRTRIPRGRIYDILNSLVEKDIVESQDSRPKRFRAVTPKIALKNLIERRNRELEIKSRQLNRLVSEIESTMTEMTTNSETNTFWIVTQGNKENVNLLITSLAEVKNEILTYTELEENDLLFSQKIAYEIIRALRRNVNMKVLLAEGDINSLFSQYGHDFISKIIPFIGKNLLIKTVEEVHSPFDIVDGEKVNFLIKNPCLPKQFIAAVSFLDKDLANTLREEFYELWKNAKPLNISDICPGELS